MAIPPKQFLNKLVMLLFYMPLSHLPKLQVSFLKIQGLHALQVALRGHAHHLKSYHNFFDFHFPPSVFAASLKSDNFKAFDYFLFLIEINFDLFNHQ